MYNGFFLSFCYRRRTETLDTLIFMYIPREYNTVNTMRTRVLPFIIAGPRSMKYVQNQIIIIVRIRSVGCAVLITFQYIRYILHAPNQYMMCVLL